MNPRMRLYSTNQWLNSIDHWDIFVKKDKIDGVKLVFILLTSITNQINAWQQNVILNMNEKNRQNLF
jgi:hypothetical protein